MRGLIVTIEDYIDAGLTLGLTCAQTLKCARDCGLRIRNADWSREWRERKEQRNRVAA